MINTSRLLVTLALVLSFSFVGCSSNKKNSGDSSSSVEDVVDQGSEAVNFEVNGSSDSGTAGGLATVFFGFDSSSLGSSTRMNLDANVELMKANPDVSVQIEGHCDERGGIEYNLALGERRARAVKNYMVSMGISSSRITTISFGKEKPVSFGHDESSWSQNRRATFVVTSK